MRKANLVLTAVAVLITVGTALAFKARQNPNLRWCVIVRGVEVCALSPYSDIAGQLTGYPITQLYKQGVIGQNCSPANCTVNPTQRFLNQ